MPGGSPRWLLIGNSRWHWAVAKGGELRVEHGPPPVKALEPGLIDDLVAWAAVGPLPTAVSLPPQRRLGLEQVPLAELPPWLGLDRALAGWLAWRRHGQAVLVADMAVDDEFCRIVPAKVKVGGKKLGEKSSAAFVEVAESQRDRRLHDWKNSLAFAVRSSRGRRKASSSARSAWRDCRA